MTDFISDKMLYKSNIFQTLIRLFKPHSLVCFYVFIGIKMPVIVHSIYTLKETGCHWFQGLTTAKTFNSYLFE